METTIYIKATPSEIESLFNNHINYNADIRFYQFVAPLRCKAVIRHCEEVTLKDGATYSLKGLLVRCETTLDKLKRKLSDLESKLLEVFVLCVDHYGTSWDYVYCETTNENAARKLGECK